MAGTFTPASFALDLDDPLTLTELTGDGDYRTVYVDGTGPRAFFALELDVITVR